MLDGGPDVGIVSVEVVLDGDVCDVDTGCKDITSRLVDEASVSIKAFSAIVLLEIEAGVPLVAVMACAFEIEEDSVSVVISGPLELLS